jgi:hypothetical protein
VAGPGNDLPFIDRLVIEVAADRSATWAALIEVLTRSLESRGSRLGSRLLESSVLEAGGPRPLDFGWSQSILRGNSCSTEATASPATKWPSR